MTAKQEENLVHDFNKFIELKNIEFKGNMKVIDNLPVITEDEVSDIVKLIEIPYVQNKIYNIDETLDISFSINKNSIAESSLDEVFSTKELLAQAYVALFTDKVRNKIKEILEDMKNKKNEFETSTEEIF